MEPRKARHRTSDTPLLVIDGEPVVDLRACPGTCGPRNWCEVCRWEIRQEALHWLQQLNRPRAPRRVEEPVLGRVWHPAWLLADS